MFLIGIKSLVRPKAAFSRPLFKTTFLSWVDIFEILKMQHPLLSPAINQITMIENLLLFSYFLDNLPNLSKKKKKQHNSAQYNSSVFLSLPMRRGHLNFALSNCLQRIDWFTTHTHIHSTAQVLLSWHTHNMTYNSWAPNQLIS